MGTGSFMKKISIILIITIIIMNPSPFIFAENYRNLSTFGSFLKIGIGARPSGMADTFTSVANDANSIYWNPAGLGLMEKDKSEITLTHTQWIADTKIEFIGLAHSIKNIGSFGLGISYLNYGTINERDETGQETGSSFKPYDLLITSSYARNLFKDTLIGTSVKVFRESILDTSYSTILFDIGAIHLIELGDLTDLNFGVTIQNFGFKMKEYNLPINVRIGTSLRIFQVSFFFADEAVWELAKYNKKILRKDLEDSFTLAVESYIPLDNKQNINIGFEYWVYDIVAVRGGYKYKIGGNDLGPISGLAVGGSIVVFGPVLDYAYVPYADLGNAHRVSLTFSF